MATDPSELVPSPSVLPVAAWNIEALARGDERAEAQVRLQTREIARALAAHSLATAPDAEVAEYEARVGTLSRTIWPDEPLDGFSLESSLGAYLIARLASGWAPPTSTELRKQALSVEGLRRALREAGVSEDMAVGVVGDWPGAPPTFAASEVGLEVAVLAGLAERTLTTEERNQALSQVAHSPRCLSRLASVCNALFAVRRLLPILPSPGPGIDASTLAGLTAVSLGLPDRALDLLGHEPSDPVLKTLAEISRAHLMLERGEHPNLPDDLMLPFVDVEDAAGGAGASGDGERGAGDEDEYLEVVEEKLNTGTIAALAPTPEARPQLADWSQPDWEPVEIEDAMLDEWVALRARRRALFSRLGSLLGLSSAPERSWIPPRAIPPEKNALIEALQSVRGEGDPSDAETDVLDPATIEEETRRLDRATMLALLPNVRSALRAIVAAAEGQIPSRHALERAGDLAWVIHRARALALTVHGRAEPAVLELTSLGGPRAPEGRFAYMMHLRFDGREPTRPSPEEARRIAARLVGDLGQQFGRTVAGSI